ncbi:MAG: hypothetical protein ACFFBP_17850 [Promethearchaeota archaeon]
MVMNITEKDILKSQDLYLCEICKKQIPKGELAKAFKITHGFWKKGVFIEFNSPIFVHAMCFK